MFDFGIGFEMKQEMIWEINGWVLWGHWLITYMKSMLDCHVIEIEKRKGNRKRSKRAYQDRGTWELKSSQWSGVAKLLIF